MSATMWERVARWFSPKRMILVVFLIWLFLPFALLSYHSTGSIAEDQSVPWGSPEIVILTMFAGWCFIPCYFAMSVTFAGTKTGPTGKSQQMPAVAREDEQTSSLLETLKHEPLEEKSPLQSTLDEHFPKPRPDEIPISSRFDFAIVAGVSTIALIIQWLFLLVVAYMSFELTYNCPSKTSALQKAIIWAADISVLHPAYHLLCHCGTLFYQYWTRGVSKDARASSTLGHRLGAMGHIAVVIIRSRTVGVLMDWLQCQYVYKLAAIVLVEVLFLTQLNRGIDKLVGWRQGRSSVGVDDGEKGTKLADEEKGTNETT